MISGLMITYYTDVRSQLLAQEVDERYIPVIEYVVKNGSITNSDLQNILGVSKATASRILQQLTDCWICREQQERYLLYCKGHNGLINDIISQR